MAVVIIGFHFSCGQDYPSELLHAYKKLPEEVDYNYHVKPILSDKCYQCHGPDENSRKAGLRLDTEEGAFGLLKEGGRAFIAGKPGKSVAIQRILSQDASYHMPPPESNLEMTPEDQATILKWVEQGAEWKKHWSFIPLEKPAIPTGLPEKWKNINEIDYFILKKIQLEGLMPSPQADKERLLRRVTMDLTGLPPTLKEINEFLLDSSLVAYERVVDRLLESDAHAERLAMEWLDVSRYADSHGMHADGYRMMWPWRDWVIKAYKENMPYNQFVTMQLAGDLLPNSTQDQILATAFNRNHPMTDEGGVIDEEFRLKYVADRTITTATAFLGMTMECASCHDHKFDPISQKEFYQMSAFFNNVKELGMTGADGNYGPMLLLTDTESEKKIDEIKHYIDQKENQLTQLKEQLHHSVSLKLPEIGTIQGLIGHYPLEYFKSSWEKENYLLDGNPRCMTKVAPQLVPGKVGNALKFSGEYDELYLNDIGLFEAYDEFSAGVWVNTSKKEENKTQTILGNSGQKNNFWRGWDFYLDSDNRLNVRLIHSLPHNYLHVTSLDSVSLNEWTFVMFTYDGSLKAEGVNIFVNGKMVQTVSKFDRLYKTIYPIKLATHIPEKRALRVGKSYRLHTGEFGIFKGLMDEIRIYERKLSSLEVKIIHKASESNKYQLTYNPEEAKEYFSTKNSLLKSKEMDLRNLRKSFIESIGPIDEVMVMEEMTPPRETFVLERGEYNSPGESVRPGTPEAILPFPHDLPANRLGLAKWIFDPRNPLTARVTVNRYWQMIFGKGLVRTTNDFGNQGDLPTHPELLNWLAVDFMESGWNLRALLKKMVMSATYRQTSKSTQQHLEADPNNLLLSRSPSYRWPAEIIRDNALAASGLLEKAIGGHSVKPYQPEGLWRELSNYSRKLLTYKQDSGQSLYRRSMYTFIRRSSPPPFMTIFDAPNRDICTVSRERTNTPLQALVLMNDPQFVEAAKALAERISNEAMEDLDKQIVYAFRLSTGRSPNEKEIEVLRSLYFQEEKRFKKYPEEAKQLLSVGEYELQGDINKTRLAALTMVANTIFNHDETYMKR